MGALCPKMCLGWDFSTVATRKQKTRKNNSQDERLCTGEGGATLQHPHRQLWTPPPWRTWRRKRSRPWEEPLKFEDKLALRTLSTSTQPCEWKKFLYKTFVCIKCSYCLTVRNKYQKLKRNIPIIGRSIGLIWISKQISVSVSVWYKFWKGVSVSVSVSVCCISVWPYRYRYGHIGRTLSLIMSCPPLSLFWLVLTCDSAGTWHSCDAFHFPWHSSWLLITMPEFWYFSPPVACGQTTTLKRSFSNSWQLGAISLT